MRWRTGKHGVVVLALSLAGVAGCFDSHGRPGDPAHEPAVDLGPSPAPDTSPSVDPSKPIADPSADAPTDIEPEPTTMPEPPLTLAHSPVSIEAEPEYPYLHHHQILGDLDGDGIDDFVVFAMDPLRLDPLLSTSPGAAYVFYGRADLPSSIDVRDADASFVGESIFRMALNGQPGALGDVNGDGLADFVLASPNAVHFVFGSEQRLSGEQDLDAAGTSWRLETTGWPGSSVALISAGDVQGDGIADFTLTFVTGGVPGPLDQPVVEPSLLTTYLINGHRGDWPSGPFDVGWATAELTTEVPPGALVSAAADLDGDGFTDLVLLSGGTQRFVRGGDGVPVGSVDLSDVGVPFAALYGQMTRLPDLDGDGSDELAWKDFGGFPGRYMNYGGSGLVDDLVLIPDAELSGDGQAIEGIAAADLDGDGFEDLIVMTAGLQVLESPPPGGLYVVPGGRDRLSGLITLDDSQLLVAGEDGEGAVVAPGRLGGTLDASGDVNGDGIADILVAVLGASTAPGNGPAGSSQVLLILGGLEPRAD